MANQATGRVSDHAGTKNKAASEAASPRDNRKQIDFVKIAPLMGGISLLLTIVSLVLMFTKGFNYGIDFAGGTEIQVRFPQAVAMADVRSALEQAGIDNPGVQAFSEKNEFLIRLETPLGRTEKETNDLNNANVEKVKTVLASKFGTNDESIVRVDTVGPQVGSELKRNGMLAAFYSFLVIIIYVSLRFDYKYAPGAVLCLVHDALMTLGVFSLLGREFNVQIMAAILTLIGYSLNDTIVTFDRIRETAPQNRHLSLKAIINKAINDMLGRTILTASTTMIAVLALYFFGGGVIAEIAFTLIVGIIVGTYSSIYVAAPMVLLMEKFDKKKAA